MKQSELIFGDVLYLIMHRTKKRSENIFQSLSRKGKEVRKARYDTFKRATGRRNG